MPSPEWNTDIGDKAQCGHEAIACRITGGVVALRQTAATAIAVREAGDSLMIRLNSSPQQYHDPA